MKLLMGFSLEKGLNLRLFGENFVRGLLFGDGMVNFDKFLKALACEAER